jgi:hypothetical protein
VLLLGADYEREAVMNWSILCIAAALLLIPSVADAECGDGDCAVGALGTGGTSSGGKAQGFRFERPAPLFPGETQTTTGNNHAGRGSITGVGSISGNIPGDGTFRGRAVGTPDDCVGFCDNPFE